MCQDKPLVRLRTSPTARQPALWRSIRRASWILSKEASSVPRARHLIRAQLADWGFHGQSELTELLTSELVTNALRHGWGEPALTICSKDGTLRCEVEDESPGLPRVSHGQDEGDEGGRGLHLVDLLSDRWGIDRRRTGKTVWFEVPMHAGERARPVVKK
jgi:anti-sigma regulatory factor (Ser/Thr protein kinase)